MTMSELEGYDEVIQKLVSSLAPEQRVAGLAPQERLAGLRAEEQVLALSDELLRRLPEDFVRTLPADVQEEIRRRVAGAPR
ncbi:MAG: hypothetical protein IT372_17930 [Polyangiaceae bacterium]|nr:hypothetical protein [Polyangiaceae bacterium]